MGSSGELVHRHDGIDWPDADDCPICERDEYSRALMAEEKRAIAAESELERLREAVDNLADAYANKGPIVAAQAYSVLMEIRAIDKLKESPDGQ